MDTSFVQGTFTVVLTSLQGPISKTASYPSRSLSLACEDSRLAARERFARQNVPSGEERKEMAVFVGYSVSLWRNSAVACVQMPAPLKKRNRGRWPFTDVSLLDFF